MHKGVSLYPRDTGSLELKGLGLKIDSCRRASKKSKRIRTYIWKEDEGWISVNALQLTELSIITTINGAYPDDAVQLTRHLTPRRRQIVTMGTTGRVEVDEPNVLCRRGWFKDSSM